MRNTHSRCVFLRSLLDCLLACRLLAGCLRVVHTVSGGFGMRNEELGMGNRELVALVCYVWIFCGNVMVVWIFFVNFVVEMLMDNRR